MKLAIWVLSGIMISTLAFGETTFIKKSTLPNGLEVHEYRLDNGMQLLLAPDHSAPVFTFQVWFKVGSATEKMDPKLQKTGLAHLFEHMMFRGTHKNPGSIFFKKISAAGAVGDNATTSFDRTNYFESLPKEKLEFIFEMESDRMVNLALDEKLFKTELGAVFGEKKMGEDKPVMVGIHKLWDLAFEQHPYKFTTMGTTEELNSFTVADAQYFYKTYYAPNNAALILVGDFEIPQALQLAEKYYGVIPSQKIPNRTPPPEPEQKQARVKEITHPLASSQMLFLAYKAPEGKNPDAAALEVIAAILAYGDGSILERDLTEKGYVSRVSAGFDYLRYPGLFTVSASLAPGKDPKTVLAIIQSAFDRIKNGTISPAEVNRAKNQYLLNTYGELLNHSSIGLNMGESLVSMDDYLIGFQMLEQVKKVTADDLVRVVKKYIRPETSNLIILSPGKEK